MSRYSKIIPGIWDDQKVAQLSRPKPNAQTLWFYVLTGPHVTPLPGLWRFGPHSASEILRWDARSTLKFAHELVNSGLLTLDPCARVVLVPGRFKHDPPASPNVIKHWRSRFDEIPDTSLKGNWLLLASDFVKGLHEGFQEAFAQAFRKDLPNTATAALSLSATLPSTLTAAIPASSAAVMPGDVGMNGGHPAKISTGFPQEKTPPSKKDRAAWREWVAEQKRQIESGAK